MPKKKTKFKKFEGEERYTSNEIPVSQKIAKDTEIHAKLDKQFNTIEQTVKYQHELNVLDTEPYYLIHINWYCEVQQKDKHDELNIIKMFYPAEIAICEFNLKGGMTRRFHRIISNIELPKGFAADTKDHIQAVHKIELDYNDGENDLKKLYAQMKYFLTNGKHNAPLPPLYTLKDNMSLNTSMNCVCSVLKTLFYHSNCNATFLEAGLSDDDWEREFKVYPLEKLLFEMGRIYVPDTMQDLVVADIVFDNDPYMYNQGLACEHHETIDSIRNCSLHMVSRWSMLIRELCLKDLFTSQKLHIPPYEGLKKQGQPLQQKTQPKSAQQQEPAPQQEKEKTYPNDPPIFVQNGVGSKPQVQHAPSAPGVASAWSRPLVHQNVGAGAGFSTSAKNNSAEENFPPLGGLRISNTNAQPGAGAKKVQKKQ